ncbi:uncharacterized protein SCHCODRAFT_02571597 [Schizophyllum commune H4-8]|uniref:uncharacterized protein n=1 Tax=Schizophyllum commune (strain H4-8 / FGSC 9210) TaxID=578458 RepID=UPI00215E171D|nr:uncharacterized protein SCHCODRAFT_02571597 [Schizophyllum commune H4-8]KAI5894790.1 hypothetical protein SCHCODRAFT_02571597 [Schizophyllum commune H4-8]
MSAPGLAVVLSGDGSSSDDGCRIACPQSLPLSRLVNPTHWHEGLVPDFAMPAIPRLLRSTTRTDQWLTQAASTNNERATSTVTGATPPADVANNATIIIEVIPAPSNVGREQHTLTILHAPRLRVKDLPDDDEPDPNDLEQATIEDQMNVDMEQDASVGDIHDAMDEDGPSCSRSGTNASDPRGTAGRSSSASGGKSAANMQAAPPRRMSGTVLGSPAPSIMSKLDLECPFSSPAAPMSTGLFDGTSKEKD